MKSPRTYILTVAAWLALGVAVAPWVGPFGRTMQGTLGKVSWDFTLGATPVWALAMAVCAALGTHEVIAAHPKARRGELSHTAHYWPTPAVLAAAAVVHAARLRSGAAVVGLAVGVGAAMAGVLWLEWATVDAAERPYARARWALNMADYAAALAAFTAALTGNLTPAQAGALCGVAAGLVALDLLRLPERTPDSVALYAPLVGAIIGGGASRMAQGGLSPTGAALILLLVAYALTGILQHHLRQQLTWRVRLEYFGLLVLGTLALLRWVA
ncbi:MAG: hypothetical protein H5T65_10960 [Chloroflexi bacterium]|nr:hypothetical protein [Chloroflexota bacterium]